MSDLYELTCKLVARGCPEHPRLKYAHKSWFIALCKADDPWELLDVEPDGSVPDARDMWTMHALEWYAIEERPSNDAAEQEFDRAWAYASSYAGFSRAAILEAIEEATRHLASKEGGSDE